MNNYIAALLFWTALISLFGLFLVWRYNSRVCRVARRQSFQYRIYALRDRAIRLVAEGIVSEDDPQWKRLYCHLNESAKAMSVDRLGGVRLALSFIAYVLMKVPMPPSKDEIDFDSLPKELRCLWAEYAATVIAICWHSRAFRWIVLSAGRVKRLRQCLRNRRPLESERFAAWRNASRAWGSPFPTA